MKVLKEFMINALKNDRSEDTDEDILVEGEEFDSEDCIFDDDISEIYENLGSESGDDSDEDDSEAENEVDGENESLYGSETEDDGEEVIHFRQWVSTDRCEFKHFSQPISKFVNYFACKLETLITHSFIAKQQAMFVNDTKNNLKVGEFLIWCDFSENFSFVLQNEAQGYYWSKKQATIHPFTIYYKNENNELQHLSYVVISECLKHDSVAVYLFITKLVKFLESQFKVISKLIFFTDGCAGQYKNRKNFFNVYCHKLDFGYECEWHFHATAHAKGPSDGLGGTLKRCATRESLARTFENQIDTAELLFQWASSSNIDMNFEYVTNAEYTSVAEALTDRFDAALTIKGTLKYHCFIPKENGQLLVKFHSAAADHKMVDILKT